MDKSTQGIFGRILIVTTIALYSYFTERRDLGLIGLMIVGFGVIYMIISLLNARTFVNEVKMTNDKIIITGYNFNSRWHKEMDINTSDIRIKSEGRGRGNVEYYLTIISGDKTVAVNRSFNWGLSFIMENISRIQKNKGREYHF